MAEKAAIVTGAGTGIGQAIALALAKRGVAVMAVGRRAAMLEETVRKVTALGGECLAHVADVGDPGSAAGILAATEQRLGRLDVLVNNAALAHVAGIENLDLAALEAMLRVNCAAVVRMCKAAGLRVIWSGG